VSEPTLLSDEGGLLQRRRGGGGAGRVTDDASSAIEAFVPVAGIQAFNAHLATAGGGVEKAITTKVNAHMRVGAAACIEKHQIACFELRTLEIVADLGEFSGGARQIKAKCPLKDLLHQGAAVDAGVSGVATEAIRGVKIGQPLHDQLTDRCAGAGWGATGVHRDTHVFGGACRPR
jgi:hypothetical protein